jgi:hypothetical protein
VIRLRVTSPPAECTINTQPSLTFLELTMLATATESIEIVCAAGAIPFLARGRVRNQNQGTYTIDVDRDASQLPAGARIILSYPDGRSDRIVAKVDSVAGNELVCSQQQLRQRERREFPRLHGGLPIRYRRVAQAAFTGTAARWLRGSTDPAIVGADDDWVQPGRFMNYSVTGLRFRTDDEISLNEVLLIELGVPDRAERWRCTGRCVFAGANPDGEGNVIAIEFIVIPSEARGALTDMTLEAQAVLLG